MNNIKYLCTAFSLLSMSGLNAQDDKPNVIFIAIDDLNDWMSYLGNHPNVKTPNLDRLAESGIMFTNAHCSAPISGPSRASIMTGLRPSTSGLYHQVDDVEIKKSSQAAQKSVFLPHYFEQNGYKVMGVGKLFHNGDRVGGFNQYGSSFEHFGPKPPERMNYHYEWFGQPRHTSTDWGAYPEEDEMMPDYKIASWAIERLKENHDEPFFLGVGFIRPHVPWHVPQKWFDMFDTADIVTPPYNPDDFDDIPEIGRKIAEVPMMPRMEWVLEENKWKEIIRAYLACIAFMDYNLGRVLDAIENSDYAENTIIVAFSDHGYHLGEKGRFAKHALWQRATHVPLIFAGNGIKGGQICDAPVDLTALYPTLVDLCEIPENNMNDGYVLTPLIKNPDSEWSHAAITSYGYMNYSVFWDQYHLISYSNGKNELYDLTNDPNEWENIADQQDAQQIIKEMKQFIPSVNVPNVLESRNTVNEYFRELLNLE